MYIPKINLETDIGKVVHFMKQFSFATIVTAKDGLPVATHLPFLVTFDNQHIVLKSHFAKANNQWEAIESDKVMVIFSQPHAYISPKNYEHELNVPTWNYMAVHAYGEGKVITETAKTFEVLEATINNYEADYKQQWDLLPDDYKTKMLKGIVAFEIKVTDFYAKNKLSQNKTKIEQQKIIKTLSNSNDSNAKLIANYMIEKINKESD